MNCRMEEYLKNRNLMENAFKAGKEFQKFIKPQNFSLPNTIMKHLWKSPSNPEGYKKLIQSCKFFFAKNPILICPSFFNYSGYTEIQYWEYCSKYHDCFNDRTNCFRKDIILEKADCQFWPIGKLHIRHKNFPQNFLSKFYRSDAKEVSLHSDLNYLSHILLFSASAKNLSLTGHILDENGQQVLLENFIEAFPLLQKLCIFWNEGNIPPCINYEKVLKSLQKLSPFQTLMFKTLPDNFNIHTFLECVKHTKIQFETQLYYLNDTPTAEIETRLEEIIDLIIETKNFDYCPTLIWSYTLRKMKGHKFFPLELKIREYLSNKNV